MVMLEGIAVGPGRPGWRSTEDVGGLAGRGCRQLVRVVIHMEAAARPLHDGAVAVLSRSLCG